MGTRQGSVRRTRQGSVRKSNVLRILLLLDSTLHAFLPHCYQEHFSLYSPSHRAFGMRSSDSYTAEAIWSYFSVLFFPNPWLSGCSRGSSTVVRRTQGGAIP